MGSPSLIGLDAAPADPDGLALLLLRPLHLVAYIPCTNYFSSKDPKFFTGSITPLRIYRILIQLRNRPLLDIVKRNSESFEGKIIVSTIFDRLNYKT